MADTGLTVRFERDGRVTNNVIEWEIDSSYLVSTDGFSFTLLEQGQKGIHQHEVVELLRGLEGEPVELSLAGASQVLGRIDITERGESAHRVVCRGRDYIADLVESNVDPALILKSGITLGDALLTMMSPCGIDTVYGDDIDVVGIRIGKPRAARKKNAGGGRGSGKTPPPAQALGGDKKPKHGEGIYEFCNRLVARHGATIQPGPDRRSITLNAPDYDQLPSYTLSRTDDLTNSSGNNIISATATRDFSKFPTYALFTGAAVAREKGQQPVPIREVIDMVERADEFGFELGEIMRDISVRGRQKGDSAAPPNGLLYRLLTHRDEQASTQTELRAAAMRAIAERLRDTLSYRCTVKGHADPATGAIYSVNTLARVSDSIADVHEDLWVASRKLTYRQGQGAMTELELIRPKSFQIEP